MDRDSDDKTRSKERSQKLFAILVLTGASLAASLATTACTDSKPAPSDAGSEGGGAHFW